MSLDSISSYRLCHKQNKLFNHWRRLTLWSSFSLVRSLVIHMSNRLASSTLLVFLIISLSRKGSATFYFNIRILFWENEWWFWTAEKRLITSTSSAPRECSQNFRTTLRSLDHASRNDGLWTSTRGIKITRRHLRFAQTAKYGAVRCVRSSSVARPPNIQFLTSSSIARKRVSNVVGFSI